MENKTSTEDNTKFSVKATLLTIENDEMVDEVFREYVSLDYLKLHKMNDENLLNETVKNHIKGMFIFIVKNRSTLEDYQMFYNRMGDDQDEELISEEEVKEVKIKEVKPPSRPRVRIVKKNVLEVKQSDNNVCHDGALATLRLKNIHPRLERAYANETLFDEPLTEEQWKQIIGVIDTTEKRINQILKG